MKIIVLIKQVPLLENIRFDRQTRRIVRAGIENEINPFDKRAIAEAIRLRNLLGGEVVAVTMGPPQAEDALVESMAMGADRAVHLVGREYAGADSLATARTLAQACRRIGFDLILCGKHATDAETAQVPSMLAELLDLPQLTGVTKVQVAADARMLLATLERDDGLESVESPLPAILSAAERLAKPIKVTLGDMAAARNRPIEVLTAANLGGDPSQFGVAGSPTLVSDIYSVETQRKRVIRTVDTGVDVVVGEVVSDLLRAGLFGVWQSRPPEMVRPKRRSDSAPARSIWVVVELANGAILPVSFELLGRAVQLANQSDGEVAAVSIGYGMDQHVKMLAARGADRVILVDAPELADYATEPYTDLLVQAIRAHDPFAVLIASTARGRDVAPRVAARLGVGLTGDSIGLELDAEGRLVQLKPAFGGNIIAPILSKTRPAMTTVRPGVLRPMDPDDSRDAKIDRLSYRTPAPSRVRLVGREPVATGGFELDAAQIIVAVGAGIGGADRLGPIRDLAGVLQAPVAGTRKVVDLGWLPRQVQIGLTGRSIAPRLYVAVGISGKFNHMVGVRRADLILAINNSPAAEIFANVDYGIVGDWADVVPALTRALRDAHKQTHHEEQQ